MLSVVIVNYKSLDDIENCLTSAFQYESAKEMEWIIINNDTTEKEGMKITEKFPSAKWIDLGYNGGFARANNRGIAAAKGDTVLLLNPDTVILDDAISKCYKRLSESSEIGASVQLLNLDGSLQITGYSVITGGLNNFYPLLYLGDFLHAVADTLKVKKGSIKNIGKEEKVDWIRGAFLMVKKCGIEKAGMLDEDFFLYAEETEWCSRLKKNGNLCVYGDIRTIHAHGKSIDKATESKSKGHLNLTGKKGLQLMVSQHLRVRKEFGNGWFMLHLLVHTLEIPIFFFGSFLENSFRFKNPFREWNRAVSFLNNVLKLWSLSPRIIRNRPYLYKML